VVYVQNRTPHQALGDKTLKEVFTGVKFGVGHLRIFSYHAYFHHVSKDKRNKMKATRNKFMFVGYYENSKAFRIYMASQKNFNFRRDVTFDEDVALGKARDIPPPPVEKKDDSMDLLEFPSIPEPKIDVVYDPWSPWTPWILHVILLPGRD